MVWRSRSGAIEMMTKRKMTEEEARAMFFGLLAGAFVLGVGLLIWTRRKTWVLRHGQ